MLTARGHAREAAAPASRPVTRLGQRPRDPESGTPQVGPFCGSMQCIGTRVGVRPSRPRELNGARKPHGTPSAVGWRTGQEAS